MSLVTSASLYAFVRAESTAELSLMDTFISGALGIIESYIGRSVRSTLVNMTDDGGVGATSLILSQYPVSGSITVADVDGVVVESTNYTIRSTEGRIVGLNGYLFNNGPYTITAYTGLEHHPQYASRIEPVVNMAILDIASDLYSRRQPAISNESAAETAVSYVADVVPPRTAGLLAKLAIIPITR